MNSKPYFLAAIVLSAFIQVCMAQVPCAFPVFKIGKTFPTGEFPWSVAKGDVNGDGKLDLVNTNFQGSNISTLLGDGNGGFAPRIDSPANSIPTALVLERIDADAYPDAIVVNEGLEDTVTVLLGNGLGSFAIASELAVTSPLFVKVADVNNDSKQDLVVIGRKLVVFLGSGNGSFGQPIEHTLPGGGGWRIVVGDFDEDGKIDVVASGNGSFFWKGDGTGQFFMQPSFSLNTGDLVAGNFDRDGHLDVAMKEDMMTIFTGNGNGTFTRRNSYELGRVPGQAVSADLNRDLVDDLMTSNGASNELSVLLAKGDGTFEPTVNYTTSGESQRLAVGDFNNDTFLDAAVAGARDQLSGGRENHIRLTLGGANGTFQAPINYPIFRDAYPNSAEIADLNGDGLEDVVTANSAAMGLSIFLRTGPFRFAPRRDLAADYVHKMVIRDFNRDGKPDIVGVAGNHVTVFLGDGTGGFTSAGTFPTASWAVAVVAADFDNDGNLDIVVGAFDSGRFSFNHGNGNGTFEPRVEYPSGLDPIVDLTVGDFNGDGRPDLAVAYDIVISIDSKVQIWLNQGNGFSQGAIYSVGQSMHPSAVLAADLNQDGKQDFIVTMKRDTSVPSHARVYLGNGNGTFSYAGPNNVDGWSASDIVTGDFNLDGRLDLATVNDGSENVSVFENLGSGAFSLREKITAGDQPRKMASGNLNADSSPDIIVTNFTDSSFTMMPNSCNEAREPEGKTPFDFDGDGKTDIGIFRPAGGASEWWINRSSTGATFALQFGASTDRITPADYTGDGKADIAFFRPSSGEWYVLRSEDFSFFALPFGTSGDVPVPADYDADGKADFAVFRPSSSTWFISQSSGAPTRIVQFGAAGDQPVVADYDGDSKADIGVFRNAAGAAQWWIDRSTAGSLALQFGVSTDKAVQGDYTGDGKADVAIWRPSTGEWFILRSEDLSFFGFPFGASTDTPAPGDYDGDGKFDATVFRPSNATWFIARSTAGTQIVQFGATGDRPIANAFVP